MLVEFSVSNVLSFKEKVTLSLLAAPIKEKDDSLSSNVVSINKTNYLKTAAIFGANSSGKTNLIKALKIFLETIFFTSNQPTGISPRSIVPFLLNTQSKDQPSEFEIVIYDDDTFFTYGFGFHRSEVVSEKLSIKKKRSSYVFDRKGNEYEIPTKYKILNEIVKKKMVPKNTLFITKAAQFNDSISMGFLDILSKLKVISGISDFMYRDFTIKAINDQSHKDKIIKLLKFADFTIMDIESINTEGESITFNINQEQANVSREKRSLPDIIVKRNVYDQKGNQIDSIYFNMMQQESEGTIKFFHILGPIIDCLQNGFTLFVDELDVKLHPVLVKEIINLFHNCESNPKNAQLVFTTHNATLLGQRLLRRDQIWLVEKNEFGESEIYSLIDFKHGNNFVRNDASIEKNYLIGKYGAIPFIPQFYFNKKH
jgi:uncharacterized protein